jgi:hypothetical protein
MRIYKFTGLVGCMLLISMTRAQATDYHVCDCGVGADIDCVAGNDGNVATDVNNPWLTHEKGRVAFATINGGDAILFCQGGAWDINSGNTRWINNNCTANNRCEIGAYLPSWASGDEARPILRRLDGANGMDFVDGGNANHEEGYRVSDIHLLGTPASATFGMFFYNDIDDVTVENVRIEGFQAGFHLAGSNACDPNDLLCDGKNENIDLLNSEIINNREQGWLGGSTNSAVINNVFFNNGNRASFDHNIYVSGNTVDMVVQNNHLKYSALDINGVCQGTSLVVHGVHHNLLIDGNYIEEDLGMAGFGCWGIAADGGSSAAEVFTNMTISNNTVKNVGNLAIGVGSCQNCVIENNVIMQSQFIETIGIASPDRVTAVEDSISTGIVVRNNTLFFGPNSTGTGVKINDEGNNHQIVSNVIDYAGNQSNFNCIHTNLAGSDFIDIDYNLCHYPSAAGAQWSQGFNDLAAWQNASGFDMNSNQSDPQFKNSATGDFSASNEFSPMVDAGHLTLSSIDDFNQVVRDSAPDKGAFEYVLNDVIFIDGFE